MVNRRRSHPASSRSRRGEHHVAARVAPPAHAEPLAPHRDPAIDEPRFGSAFDVPAPFGPAEPAAPALAPPAAPVIHVDRPPQGRPRRGAVHVLLRSLALAYLLVIVAGIVVYKAAFWRMVFVDPVFELYGLIVSSYIISRFGLSLFYRPAKDAGLEPHVAIVMPAFNEQDAIADSIRSLLALEYPAGKLQIVAVNDGSSDGTLREMNTVAAHSDGRVHVIDFPENRGKRAAMAAGIRATDAEMVAFVDSDSVVRPDAMRRLVQGFADKRVGAICGHADVLNVRQSVLTRMQAVRYFVAFKVIKAAESLFGCVTCCSGCFSVYRRSAIIPHLDWWETQSFLGVQSPFGDDRSLTNCVLRSHRVIYEEQAVSYTIVPHTFKKFMVQQTRWKRSWTRESLIVSTFIWRKHPLAALATYVGVILPLIAPVVALRAIVWHPLVAGAGWPLVYLAGIYAVALVYGLYFAVRQNRYDALWLSGVLFVFFYLTFLLWSTYYAILTARSRSWGTRKATPAAEVAS